MMMHMMEEEATHEGQEEEGEEKSPQAIVGDAAAPAAVVYKKGAWSKEEDEKLRRAVDKYGLRNWVAIEKFSGLGRPAKNCRLRWLNYLRPNLKKYPFTEEEEELIFELHSKYGNSWSRIASKLPGRSDNEIKNFWHKKAKKRHKHHHHHHLPIHPSTATNQNNHTGDARDEYFPNTSDHHISPAALYPQHILSSTSAPSPRILPSTPNAIAVNTSSHQSYLRIPQSPNNHLSDQTTPTSRTQNLLVSPHLRTDAMVQNDEFMILRNPPILSTPQCSLRRFSRNNSKLSANPHSAPNEAEALLSTPSPMQMQLSSAMVSPTSPLKLNLSPRVEMPPPPTMDSQASSLPPFQLQSPISPLKLRLSIPIPSESFLNSNSTVHSSPTSGLLPSKQSLPQSHSSQEITREPPSMQVEPDCSLEIMEELKEARARVKFLKNKLRLKTVSKNSNKRAYPKNMPKMNGSEESCETKTIRTESSENDYSSFTLGEIFRRGNSMSVDEQSHSTDCFHHLNPQSNSNPYDHNICSFRGLAGKFWEECSTMDSLYHQNSTLLENGDLQGGLFGQRPGIEAQLSPHSQAPPVDPFNPAHSQSTATIILIKPEDDNSSRSNYLCVDEGQYFGYGLGQEIANGFVRKLGEDCLIDDNLGAKSVFQYPKSDLLDSRSLVSTPIMEQEYFRVEQFSHQIPAGRNPELCEQKTVCGNRLIDNVVESRSLAGPAQEWPALERCGEGLGETEIWRQEHSREQSFMQGLLVDELWPEGLLASQDRTFSTSRDSELKKIWNDEAGEVLKQDHINTMSEELSSLLEFFPTTSQGQDWYYTIGNAIPNTNSSSGFDNPQMSPTSHPQLTIADYL